MKRKVHQNRIVKNEENMKKTFAVLSVLMLIIHFSVIGQDVSIDKKNGFKDLTFQSPMDQFLASHKTIKILSEDRGTSDYKIIDARYLLIGDCKIQELVVTFFQNKLLSFNIKVDKAYKIDFLNALYYAWGNGLVHFQGKDSYFWNGSKYVGSFDDDEKSGGGTLVFFSKVLKSQLDQFNQNADRENSKDL